MEGIRIEQLVLLAVVLLAALADYIARARRRDREESDREIDPTEAAPAEEYETEWTEAEAFEPDFEPERPRWEDIAPVLTPTPPAPHLQRPSVPPPPQPPRPGRRRRGRRGQRWMRNTRDARRGIVVMTILGPCRGLERSESQ